MTRAKLSDLTRAGTVRKVNTISPNWNKKKNKFNSVSCKCKQEHIHKSRVEARDCDTAHLLLLPKDSPYYKVDTEVKFEMVVGGVHICNHYMDHVLRAKTGYKQKGYKDKAIETKGFKTGIWSLKSKLFKALYPEYEYEIWKH